MGTLELVALNRDHVIDVFPRRRGEATAFNLQEIMFQVGSCCQAGPSYATVAGDLTVAVGGVYEMHKGVGNVWILGTDAIRDYAREFTELMKIMIPEIMEAHNLHRLQGDVITSQPNWIKWTKSLGFEEEGILRKFRGQHDSMCLSIIREDV